MAYLGLGGPDIPVEILRGRPTRVYVAGWRIHHGPVGILFALLGVALLVHDWRDKPWRVRPKPLTPEQFAELRQG